MSARQLSFDLPTRTALGRADFFVSPANAEAVALIEGWHGWPSRKLVVAGPAGAGKTRVLRDRVLRLLLAGVPPQRVLCLTFTKAAAEEMQQRLGVARREPVEPPVYPVGLG